MYKINIVSSHAVIEVSSFSTDTRKSSKLMVNSLVKNRLFKAAPDIDEPPFQFIHTMEISLVDMTLHDSPDIVIHNIEIWAVWRPQVGRSKVWRFLTQQFNNYTTAVCQCIVVLKHKVVTIHSVDRWQQFLSQKDIMIVCVVYFWAQFNNNITQCSQV